MKMTFGEALRHAAEITGRSIRGIAHEADVPEDALKNLVQGKAQRTNFEYAMKVVDVFGVSIEDFLSGALSHDHPTALVAVAGKVGAGAFVPLVDAYEKGDGLYHVAAPPQLRAGASGIVAVEVDGDSMAPMYQPGDVLFYSRAAHEGIAEEDVGRPCVVEDADGQAWVKLVRFGDAPKRFHLLSLNPGSLPRYNQQIKWASRVRLVIPAEMVARA